MSVIIRIVVFIILLSGVNAKLSAANLKVVASIYPLAHFAGEVGGSLADITNIMPPGVEPHEFEPTPRDISRIYKADIFLFHGAGLDPWAHRISYDLEKEGVLVREISRHFTLLKISREEHRDEDHPANDEHVYEYGNSDPHIWLDPLLALREVEIIRDAFIEVDPNHKEAYTDNCSTYINALIQLDKEYREGLQSCDLREIIVTHDAFHYLAERYHLLVHAIMSISPEEAPSPRKLVELSKLVREKGITHIFSEPLMSPKLAETLAGETGAKMLVLNPLGGLTEEDIRRGGTYISVMKENLRNLRTALKCK